MKREHIEDARINAYLDVLDQKSQRLKQLTEDLVEVSKISSGNVELHMTNSAGTGDARPGIWRI